MPTALAEPLDLPLPCPRAEYAGRLAEAQAEIARRNLAALLVFSQQSLYYLFGYQIIHGAALYQVIIVPASGTPLAVLRYIDEPILKASAFTGDIATWAEFGADPVDSTMAMLAQARLLQGARLGIETRHQSLYPYYYEQLRQAVTASGGEFIEASDIVTEQRIRKSPAEVAAMRRAGRLLDVTFEAAFAAMRAGARECEVNAAALYAAHMAGADENAQPLLISSGRNTLTSTHLAPTQRAIRQGEPILMEAGASSSCYHAVGGHTVVCGRAPDKQMRGLYEDARRAVRAGRAALGPGVATAEVARAMIAATEGTVTAEFIRRSHGGYGIGIGFPSMWHDSLVVNPADPHVLTPGVTLALFGFSQCPGQYSIMSVDPVVITDSGFDDLSTPGRDEMRIVGN